MQQERATRKERDNLYTTRYSFSDIQKRPGLERSTTAKPTLVNKSMVSKCFECELLYFLWGEPTAQQRTYCQSPQLADNWIINKINPVSSLLITEAALRGLSFGAQVGTTIWTSSCTTQGADKPDVHQQWNHKDGQHWETKVCFCLQTRSALLNPNNEIHLPRRSAASLINRSDKDACRRKMGKLLPHRWTFKTETHLSLSKDYRECAACSSQIRCRTCRFSLHESHQRMENKFRHVDPTTMIQVQRPQQQSGYWGRGLGHPNSVQSRIGISKKFTQKAWKRLLHATKECSKWTQILLNHRVISSS